MNRSIFLLGLVFIIHWLSISYAEEYNKPLSIPELVDIALNNKPLSIPELVDIALNNNPETRSAWWNARKVAALRGLAASSYYPTIRARASAAHARDYKFPNGKETVYTDLDGDIFLNYLLYDFGERTASNQAAVAALWAANWQSDWRIQKVLFHVVAHTYSYLNSLELSKSRQASLDDAKTALDAATQLQQAGLNSVTDVYTTKASVADLEINVALQKAETDVARSKLLTVLGICIDTPLEVASLPNPSSSKRLQCGLDSLIALARDTRADLMGKWAELVQKRAQLEKNDKKYAPKLNFGADAGYNRYIHDTSNGFRYNVGLTLDIPLFNGFESIYYNRLAYADMQATEADLERLDLEIALDVMAASRYFEAAQQILIFAKESLENSMRTFEGVLDKYKAGTQSIFHLTAAQKQLGDARIKHSEAKTRWHRILAELAFATGTISQYSEEPCRDPSRS